MSKNWTKAWYNSNYIRIIIATKLESKAAKPGDITKKGKGYNAKNGLRKEIRNHLSDWWNEVLGLSVI